LGLRELALAAASYGLVAEERSSTIILSAEDGTVIAGPGGPVHVDGGPPYAVSWPGGRVEAPTPEAAVVAAYAAFAAHSSRLARREHSMARNMIEMRPVEPDCERWASRLTGLAGTCRLLVGAAAVWEAVERTQPPSTIAGYPGAGGAREVRDALCRLPRACDIVKSAAALLAEAPGGVHSLPGPTLLAATGKPWHRAAVVVHAAHGVQALLSPRGPGEIVASALASWPLLATVEAGGPAWEAILAASTPPPAAAASLRRGARVRVGGGRPCRGPCIIFSGSLEEAVLSARLRGLRAALYTHAGEKLAAAVALAADGSFEVPRAPGPLLLYHGLVGFPRGGE